MGALRGLHHPLLPGAFVLRLCQLLQLLGALHAFKEVPLRCCFPALSASNAQALMRWQRQNKFKYILM